MPFDKQYKNRKDWRRPYLDRPRSIDASCRSHGNCPYCQQNRSRASDKKNLSAREQVEEQ